MLYDIPERQRRRLHWYGQICGDQFSFCIIYLPFRNLPYMTERSVGLFVLSLWTLLQLFLVIFLYFSRKRWSTYTASEAGRFQSRITLDIERWTRGILRDGIICCRPQSSCSWSADSATGLSAWLCCESWCEYICGVKKTTGNRLHCLILSDFFMWT